MKCVPQVGHGAGDKPVMSHAAWTLNNLSLALALSCLPPLLSLEAQKAGLHHRLLPLLLNTN